MYEDCLKRGAYREIAINEDKIKSAKENAATMISAAKKLSTILDNDEEEWLSVFLGSYDALHLQAEAFLRSKGLRASDHKCLFAYVKKQTNITGFEKLRKARNDTHYYGKKMLTKELRKLSEEAQQLYEQMAKL